MKLNFITKRKVRASVNDLDVSIKVLTRKEPRRAASLQFIFRNNSFRAISETGYIVVAIEGTRLYFKGETKEFGFKLSQHSKETNRYCRIQDMSLTDWAQYKQGEYPLRFDREHHLFFIETKEAKKWS